jgi:hypothetical protein
MEVKWPHPPGSARSRRASPQARHATVIATARITAPANPGRAAAMSSTEPLTGPRKSSQLK